MHKKTAGNKAFLPLPVNPPQPPRLGPSLVEAALPQRPPRDAAPVFVHRRGGPDAPPATLTNTAPQE